MKVERVGKIDHHDFVAQYLANNRPVIITDGMDTWAARQCWTPMHLTKRFGDQQVQIYDDLFRIIFRKTLREYIERYFGQNAKVDGSTIVPYVRWYTKFKEEPRLPWADKVFAELSKEWSLPYFLPSYSYLVPFSGVYEEIFPNTSSFPARGLFISPRGGRTRLHFDPWCSDAILCQVYGRKHILMWSPEQMGYLVNNGKFVDPDNVDYEKFPEFDQVAPLYNDYLEMGEIIFIPNRWLHHVTTLEDSISLTWNFVHAATWRYFSDYLMNSPPEEEIKTIRYFISDFPSFRNPH